MKAVEHKIWAKLMEQSSETCHRPDSWLHHCDYTTHPQRFPGIIRLHLIITDWSSAAVMLLQSGQLWFIPLVLSGWPVARQQSGIIVFGLVCGGGRGLAVAGHVQSFGKHLRCRICFFPVNDEKTSLQWHGGGKGVHRRPIKSQD